MTEADRIKRPRAHSLEGIEIVFSPNRDEERVKSGAKEVAINHTLMFVHGLSISISERRGEERSTALGEEWRAHRRCATQLSFLCEVPRDFKHIVRPSEQWVGVINQPESSTLHTLFAACLCLFCLVASLQRCLDVTAPPIHCGLTVSQRLSVSQRFLAWCPDCIESSVF